VTTAAVVERKKKRKNEKKAAEEPIRHGGPLNAAAEALVWLWGLGMLGYFYYAKDFFNLLRQVGEHLLG
jgi:hypothetical protein